MAFENILDVIAGLETPENGVNVAKHNLTEQDIIDLMKEVDELDLVHITKNCNGTSSINAPMHDITPTLMLDQTVLSLLLLKRLKRVEDALHKSMMVRFKKDETAPTK